METKEKEQKEMENKNNEEKQITVINEKEQSLKEGEKFTAKYSDVHQFLQSKRKDEIPSIPDDSYLVKACEEGNASYYVIYNENNEALTHFYYYYTKDKYNSPRAELCLYRGLDTKTEKIMKILLDRTPMMNGVLEILSKEQFTSIYIEVINQKDVISFYTKYGFLIDKVELIISHLFAEMIAFCSACTLLHSS